MSRTAWMVLMAGALAGAPAAGQSRTWDGDAGNLDWFADANWDPDGVPEATDSVVVNAAGPVVAQSRTIDIAGASIQTGLTLDSATLMLANASVIDGLTVQGCCTTSIWSAGDLRLGGTTAFVKGVRFRGGGTTEIAGTAFADDLFLADTQDVTISGELTADASVEAWNGREILVTGKLELIPGGAIREVGGGRVRNLGEVGFADGDGLGLALMHGTLQNDGGEVYVEKGRFELTGRYPSQFGTMRASDGGLLALMGSNANTIASVEFTGDGTISLRNSNNVYDGLLTASMQSPGTLALRNTMRLDGILNNTGSMTLAGVILETPSGDGLVRTSGFTGNTALSSLKVLTLVEAGGTLGLEAGLTLYEDVKVEPGGVIGFYEAGAGISKPSGSDIGRVVNGGVMVVPQGLDGHFFAVQSPVDMQAGGLVRASSGALILKGGGVWSGGVIEAAAGAELAVGGEEQLQVTGDVTARGEGRVWLAANFMPAQVEVTGTLTLNTTDPAFPVVLGSIFSGSGQVVNAAHATTDTYFKLNGTLVNNGELTYRGGPVPGLLRNVGTVHHAPGGTLTFEGGRVENEGTWVRSGPGSAAMWIDGTFVNTGLVSVENADQTTLLDVQAVFDNGGTVRVDGGGAFFLNVVQIVNGELTGGTWEAINGGRIDFSQLPISIVTGGTEVRGDGASAPWLGGVDTIGDGKVSTDGYILFTDPLAVDGGELIVEEGEAEAPKIDVSNGGTLGVGDGARVKSGGDLDVHSLVDEVEGVIAIGLLPAPAVVEAPNTNCRGRVIPGGEDRAGGFDFIGNLNLFSGSQVLVDVGGTDNTDAITVRGATTVDGTLRVALIDEFTPAGGESYTLIDAAGGLFGQFASLDLPALPGDLEWELSYASQAVVLSVVGGSCLADWNGDGSVNTQDFLAYLNDWSAQRTQDCTGGGCSADLNGDGVVNTQDFLAYLNLWVAGC